MDKIKVQYSQDREIIFGFLSSPVFAIKDPVDGATVGLIPSRPPSSLHVN